MQPVLKKGQVKRWSALGVAVAVSLNVVVPSVQAAVMKQDISTPVFNGAGKEKTNFIYIVLDDMGFSDFGAYGSEIKTPNIDKLAADGLVYNDFNVCPVCSPTRASLLTGRDNHAVGMGYITNLDMGPKYPNFRAQITDRAATVAQILQANGYSTMGVGKWHLTPIAQVTPAGPFNNWPLAKGFERFYGYLGGETDQYSPLLIYDNHQISSSDRTNTQFTADIAKMANQFITDQVSVTPDKPFFLYTAFSAVHTPLQAPKEYIELYNGVYDQGYDKIREARFEKQKNLGIIPADAKLTPRDAKVKAWESLTEDEKKVSARFMQVYAGYLTYADTKIGEIIAKLKETGQYDNTMIAIISDNGATALGGENGNDFDIKAYHREIPSVEYLKKHSKDLGGPDFGGAVPRGWANVSNTPFQNFKETVFAGGTRAPLIIHWPKGIKTKANHVRTQYAHVTDLTPTVLDIAGVKAPDTFHGIQQLPIDGTSLVPTFQRQNAPSTHGAQYYLHHNNRSIYKDGWKAIAIHQQGTSFSQDQWKLYHLTEDYAETVDVAAKYPEKLKELQALWQSEADRHGTPLQEINSIYAGSKQTVYKYYPGVGSIGMGAAPNTPGKSYSITVPIDRTSKADEGVLFSMGNLNYGYTMFIKNNKLIYEYHYFGTVNRIEVPIGLGKSLISYKFEKTDKNSGIGYLYVNGNLAGKAQIAKRFRLTGSEAMDIGCDRYSPVSADYKDKGEFPFSGQYEFVLFELEQDKK
ncbi:arylsulfatase [Anaerosinus massiliensis]|uniref:arylsulfatase n=1 Tax=Massilibacillus massiliensis TaxID=1806837 RepID=UPI000A760CC4|nr:arylsulfatase [Massilibacillus massiliensis]